MLQLVIVKKCTLNSEVMYSVVTKKIATIFSKCCTYNPFARSLRSRHMLYDIC